jgi:tetratricopeptide (TPR) repeat protein
MAPKLTASREELEARVRAAEEVLAAELPAEDSSACLDVVRALIDQGDAYREMREIDEAVGCYEQALTRLGNQAANDPRGRELGALARAAKAVGLVQVKRADDAVAASAEALASVADGQTETLRRSRAMALGARAAAFGALGRPGEAQRVAEEIISEFADDPVHGPKRANVVAGARFTRAMMLLAQDEPGPAQAAFADLIDDYGQDETPSVMLVMAKARVQQARALQRLGNGKQAAGIRVGLIDEYGGCVDRQFREVAMIAGVQHGSALIEAGQPGEAYKVAAELLRLLNARPLPDNPAVELSVLLMLTRAQRLSAELDAAAFTLRTLLGRDDLLAVAGTHAQRVASAVAALVPELARAGEHRRVLELVEIALRKLRPHVTELDHLAGLWLYRPLLIRDTGGSTSAVIAASDEIISALGGSPAAPARMAVVNALCEKSIALDTQGRARQAIAICDRVISVYGNDENNFTRERVADAMAHKADLLLKRRRRRAATRTLNQLIAYCDAPKPEPMKKRAQLAQDRMAAITAANADRRRLRIVALGLLACSLAPGVHAAVRALRRARR